jgi:hypothetical protein
MNAASMEALQGGRHIVRMDEKRFERFGHFFPIDLLQWRQGEAAS